MKSSRYFCDHCSDVCPNIAIGNLILARTAVDRGARLPRVASTSSLWSRRRNSSSNRPGETSTSTDLPFPFWTSFDFVLRSSAPDRLSVLLERLLEMLSCKKRRLPDASLSRQMNGRPEKVIECLSSIFVEIPGVYGTRTQSVILIDQQGESNTNKTLCSSPRVSTSWFWENVPGAFHSEGFTAYDKL